MSIKLLQRDAVIGPDAVRREDDLLRVARIERAIFLLTT
jgi:hypothetical protein